MSNLFRKSLIAVSALALTGIVAPTAFAESVRTTTIVKTKIKTDTADNKHNARSHGHRGQGGYRNNGHSSQGQGGYRNTPTPRGQGGYRNSHTPQGQGGYRATPAPQGLGGYRAPAHNQSRAHNHGSRGFQTAYRSGLGISFHVGTPGYSQYRWTPSRYSLYNASYGGYNNYQSQTSCRRVNMEGWHYGHRELVSVTQCSNPWNGSYIVQGSEQVVACRG